jgi:hypothetical protein
VQNDCRTVIRLAKAAACSEAPKYQSSKCGSVWQIGCIENPGEARS